MGFCRLVCLFAHFVGRLAPSPQVVVHTHRTHAGKCAQTLLLHGAVATVGKVAVGTDDERMLALGQRGIDGAAHGMTVDRLQAEVLHAVAVELPDLGVPGSLLRTEGKQLVDAQ